MKPSLKNESCNISISSITLSNDKFKEKAIEVNDYFARLCKERKKYIFHLKNIPYHLHKSRLSLNWKVSILSSNFAKVLSNIFKWTIETNGKDSFLESKVVKSVAVNVSSVISSHWRQRLNSKILSL